MTYVTRTILIAVCLAFGAAFVDAQKNDELLLIRVGGKVGYIDRTGKVIIEPRFEHAYEFKDGLAPVKIDDEWGFINPRGEFVIEPQFDWLYWDGFNEGICPAGVNGRKVGIDKTGKFVIEPKYELALQFSDGVMPVRIEKFPIWGEKWIYVDRTGVRVIEKEFFGADSFVDGRSFVKIGFDKWALIDKTGAQITKKPFTYDPFNKLSEGLQAVQIKEKWGYINRDGQIVIKPQFDDANNFSEGLAAVRKGCYYGFIDKTGKMVIPARFETAWKFSDGLAPVALARNTSLGLRFKGKNGKWIQMCGSRLGSIEPQGYIDRTGTMVIAPAFGRAFPFKDGIAMVSFGEPPDVIGAIGKRGYID
jgi:hypothetical protein